jgi:hypothetical protein
MSFLVSDFYSLGDVPWFLPGGCQCSLLCNKIILFVPSVCVCVCVCVYITKGFLMWNLRGTEAAD